MENETEFTQNDLVNIKSFLFHVDKLEEIIDSNLSVSTNLFTGIPLSSEKEILALAAKARPLLHDSDQTGAFAIRNKINNFAYQNNKEDLLQDIRKLTDFQKEIWREKHSRFSYILGDVNYGVLPDKEIIKMVDNGDIFHLEGKQKIPDIDIWLKSTTRRGEVLISYWKIIMARSNFPLLLASLIKFYFDDRLNLKN